MQEYQERQTRSPFTAWDSDPLWRQTKHCCRLPGLKARTSLFLSFPALTWEGKNGRAERRKTAYLWVWAINFCCHISKIELELEKVAHQMLRNGKFFHQWYERVYEDASCVQRLRSVGMVRSIAMLLEGRTKPGNPGKTYTVSGTHFSRTKA